MKTSAERQKTYRELHKEELRQKRINRTQEQKDTWENYRRKWREKTKEARKRTLELLRLEVIKMFGGKCVRCGYCTNLRALQIDHINGGGTKEIRKMGGDGYPRYYKRLLETSGEGYQLLCANCNVIKKFEEDLLTT